MFLSEWREIPAAPCLAKKKKNLMTARVSMLLKCMIQYRDADKSLARPGRKQTNVSVRMASAPCLAGKETWWQAASRCWNRVRPLHASELVSFLVSIRNYQHPGICKDTVKTHLPATMRIGLQSEKSYWPGYMRNVFTVAPCTSQSHLIGTPTNAHT